MSCENGFENMANEQVVEALVDHSNLAFMLGGTPEGHAHRLRSNAALEEIKHRFGRNYSAT